MQTWFLIRKELVSLPPRWDTSAVSNRIEKLAVGKRQKPTGYPDRTTTIAVITALAVAVVLAAFFTAWDWIENPGGIFRDTRGTNWRFVFGTARSWFVPVFLATFSGSLLLCLIHRAFLRPVDSKTTANKNR
jgi:hypothetical protein